MKRHIYISSEESRKNVLRMLEGYQSNLKKLKRIEEDDLIREWSTDYQIRERTGGMHTPVLQHSKTGETTKKSIQEVLVTEKENILQHLYDLRAEYQLMQLLLFNLDEDALKLVKLRYFEQLSVRAICGTLFFSRSTFYRKNAEVIDRLALEYERIFRAGSSNKKPDRN
ncbi:MAG: DUF1492 domain-containing protein [Peptoniphilaceae bacterium]|nr:DUF1492 domain-containing protein [Peptoniphilaceae bacterium]MDY5765691.1 DUF1492 domain-containing protein [Peptoniphilaceae bacterium]